jgi:predicted protein tyrosine phosphatase
LSWNNQELEVLPPDNPEPLTRANKEIAAMVYVLTKVYRQQLARDECLELRKAIPGTDNVPQ